MCSSLLSNINSEELSNENVLTNRPNCIHVLVEDEDDARFWYDLLHSVLNVLIKPECLKLKNQHKQTIKANSINPSEIKNLLNHYQSCCRNCEETLRDNFLYKEKSSLMQVTMNKIRQELC